MTRDQRERKISQVLAIGTAVPVNVVEQSKYPDFLFRVTNNNHKQELKKKLQRICDKSAINKRHMCLTEELLKENPNICSFYANSFDARQEIANREVPKLAQEACIKALQEWGGSKSQITHLVFATRSCIDMPGADYKLIKLLELKPNVKRVMLYQQGCFAGGTATRLAMDLAQDNPDARVLVVCSEVTVSTFREPSEHHLSSLVTSALFADGAAAMVVGASPRSFENPLFQLHYSSQTLVAGSDGAIVGRLGSNGLLFELHKDVPEFISNNIEMILHEPLGYASSGSSSGPLSYNDLFWVVHPGGRAILDQLESRLQLQPDRLQTTRDVLADYGNMSSACLLFVLDRMRKRTNGLVPDTGLDWGVMLAFGPGLTVECILVKSVLS